MTAPSIGGELARGKQKTHSRTRRARSNERISSEVVDLEPGLSDLRDAYATVAWFKDLYPWLDLVATGTNLLFVRTFGALNMIMNDYLGKLGTSRARNNVLRLLYQSENNRLLLSEVGTGLNVTRANVTNLIDHLQRDGFVRRVEHPTDRRMIYTELTPAGRAHFEEVEPRYLQKISELWSVLEPEEQELLGHLLSRFRHNLLNPPSGS